LWKNKENFTIKVLFLECWICILSNFCRKINENIH